MSKYFNNWKNTSDKEIQKSIELFNYEIINSRLFEIQNEIDVILEIFKSTESSLGIKLRFGTSLFLSCTKFGYPYKISDFLNSTIDDWDVQLALLNGVIDYKTSFDDQSLFKDFHLLTSLPSSNKLDLFFQLLFGIFSSGSQQYYHLILSIKKAWQILEKAHSANLYMCKFEIVETIVRHFIPLLDSSISGLTVLISNQFQSIIKWSYIHKDQCQTASRCFEFFSRDLLNEFFPFNDCYHGKSIYTFCKINLRYLKIVVQSCGLDYTLARLPLMFHYLLQTISVNYTATLSGDIFTAAFKHLQSCPRPDILNSLINVVEQFMVDGSQEFWFEEGQREVQSLNFASFVIVSGVKYRPDEMVAINNRLLTKLSSLESEKVDSEELYDHNWFMWITSFVSIYPESKSINEEQTLWINKSLWHRNDHIRITAYKFICDNYSVRINSCSPLTFSNFLNVLVNNLTSDNTGFRNHMISATKRLFVVFRDSIVSHLQSDSDLMKNDIILVKTKMDKLFVDQKTLHFELISWNTLEEMLTCVEKEMKYKDFAIFVNFCRMVYCQQWFTMSMNYQRQRSLVDLISIIRDVLVDDNFFIDKKCGFGNKTISSLRAFYRNVRQQIFISPLQTIDIILHSITVTKCDIQNDLFKLLFKTYSDDRDSVQVLFDWENLWKKTQILCHSNQPVDLNAGSIFCSFLSHSHYKVESGSRSILEYLVGFLDYLASIEMEQILETSLRTPGHGLLMALDYLVRHCKSDLILRSDHIPLASMKLIRLMLKTMGCEEDDLASFQKMGVSVSSIVSKDTLEQSVGMNIKYQHVLSWTWQVLRNTCSILISWCQMAVGQISSPIFRKIGFLFVKILCQNRHRGTIECVAGFLQTYIQLGEANGLPNDWLSARQIAINECIDGAVKGRYSITRRSAGLPLMLMSALIGSSETPRGIALANECLMRLIDLCNDQGQHLIDNWCDPPIVHYLNLIRQMCQSPPLQTALQLRYGHVLLVTIRQFSSKHWTVRNAALQLFSTMLSRVTLATKGQHSFSPTLTELISLYPQLWQPIVDVIKNNDKCFLHYQTLIPVLTLLSRFRYCNENLLPTTVRLGELSTCLWPLLASPVIQVRYLAARCLVNYLPRSMDIVIWETIRTNTSLIPGFMRPGGFSGIETLSHWSFNRQHGELVFLKLILHNLRFIDESLTCAIDSMIQYGRLVARYGCWILLETLCEIMSITAADSQESLKSFVTDMFRELLHLDSQKGTINISRLGALVSLIKLVGSLPISLDSIGNPSFFHSTHYGVIQQICLNFDQYSPISDQSMILSYLKFNIGPLIESVHAALKHYSSYFTPYVVQILCHIIDRYPKISVPETIGFSDFVNRLISMMEMFTTETLTTSCLRILTWIYVNHRFHENNNHETETCITNSHHRRLYSAWMKQVEKFADFHSLESSRLSAAQNIITLTGSEFLNRLVCEEPQKLALIVTLGCFDEEKSIRDIYRNFLNRFIQQNHENRHKSRLLILKMSHFPKMYRLISKKSHCPMEIILVNLWKSLVLHQRNFMETVLVQQSHDALYEPVPANIYIEFSLVAEILYAELWKTMPSRQTQKTMLVDLKSIHQGRILPNDSISNSSSSFLLQSEMFVEKLSENFL